MEGEKIDEQLATDVLDRGLTFITEFSGTGLRSTRFLSGLIGFLNSQHPDVAAQLAKLGETSGGIIVPSGAKMEGQDVPFHTH